MCTLNGIEVLDPEANVIIGGTHVEGYSDELVDVVDVVNSNTPFIIQQIFTTFPRMNELDIVNSQLETINIPSTGSGIFAWLFIFNNNVSRIDADSFGENDYFFVFLVQNQIQEIHEDAFTHFGGVFSLALVNNLITEVRPRTLQPLRSAAVIDFERNRLQRIGEDMFSGNTNLQVAYLEYNQISAISPRFTSAIRNHLRFVNIFGNQCASRSFNLNDDFDWAILNNVLRTCYNNFLGVVGTEREVTMRFTGSLVLFDEWGNLIASV